MGREGLVSTESNLPDWRLRSELPSDGGFNLWDRVTAEAASWFRAFVKDVDPDISSHGRSNHQTAAAGYAV
jgi:hypothetical protein